MNSLLNVVFFLSGMAALIFETLWFHQAGLALGNSVWASSLVLAGFMGGLGFGNVLAARYGHRVRRPIFVYGVLEALIGLTGIAIVVLLPLVGPLLAPALGPLLDWAWALNALRLVVSLLILLVPSTAMGVTLPLLVKAAVAQDANFGRVLGRLYGWNTVGAVTGVICAEVFLIGWLGIRGSAVVAGLVNGFAAAGAVVLARRAGRAAAVAAEPERPMALFARMPAGAWRVLVAVFLAGGSLLALEVIWFRLLLLFIHGSSLAFALMLATVLAGIGSGGLVGSAWLGRRPDASRHAPIVALAAGILCVAGYAGLRLVVDSTATEYVGDWAPTLTRGS
ncbi:MAG: fused MFS/spermidine synthase, partial [Myxococcota bacterium]